MNAPQIIWIVWMTLGLGLYMALHDKPKTGKYNFWIGLITVALQAALLWWGGFFRGPQ
jgi:uncharacterized membrane protein